MLAEFKKFALRGNMLDMAIGIIIGAAFGRIVTSFVEDILMPPIGLLMGRVDFSSLFVSLSGDRFASLDAAKAAGAPTLNYGVFLQAILNFLIVAMACFVIVRQVNRMTVKPAEPPPAATTKPCPRCLTTIPLGASRCPNCTSELAAA